MIPEMEGEIAGIGKSWAIEAQLALYSLLPSNSSSAIGLRCSAVRICVKGEPDSKSFLEGVVCCLAVQSRP